MPSPAGFAFLRRRIVPLSRADASRREGGRKRVNVSSVPMDVARATAISLHRLKRCNSNQIRGRARFNPLFLRTFHSNPNADALLRASKLM